MNEVNRTLFIPLYGKSQVSKKGVILKDETAEKIWEAEAFPIHGKSKSKWLSYNMAMRARIFDDWTKSMLRKDENALVLHIGCGLDSRCIRIDEPYTNWIDGDFPDVIETRKKYYEETSAYRMICFDACDSEQIKNLPDSNSAIVILEGISMYLTNEQLNGFFKALSEKYKSLNVLMDVYTVWGAKASKYKNPINDVGVTTVWGIDDVSAVLGDTGIVCKGEHSLTPDYLIEELKPFEQLFFKTVFSKGVYRKIYRLYELEK
ncbi:MAG: class I SAM-dependent methyltransferase [Acutalibacteraceae bacterium]